MDLEIFCPKPKDQSLRSTLGITQDQPVVVYIGVLSRYQGIDLLLEAIPKVVDKVQNVKFLIMGYPDESYRQKAKAFGVEPNTIFTGKIPYMDASRYLALGDIAISPKISTTEANQKVIAYMAMGLPTVVFDNPINREILGESGIYARNGNAESLAEAMVWLLEDRERAQALGEAGRRKATIEHSWQMVGTKLVHLYEHFGKGGDRPAPRASRRVLGWMEREVSMPSPLGHSLVGYIVFRSTTDSAGLGRSWFGLCILAANAPDLDFLPGLLLGEPNRYHHRITHSVGFAVLVALAFAFVVKFWKRVSFTKHFTLLFGLYSSHLALDYLSLDTSPPHGIPVFWPLSTQYFVAPHALFMDIHRDSSTLSFFGSLFVLHNLWAICIELALCLPLIVLASVWKKRSNVISF